MTTKEFKNLKVGDKVWVYQFEEVESRIVKKVGNGIVFTNGDFFVEPNQTFFTEAWAYKFAIKCKKAEIAKRKEYLKLAEKELSKLQKGLAKAVREAE